MSPTCSVCVIKSALGHMTVDERFFRIRPELGPRGNATMTAPNGVFSVHHLCVYVRVNAFVFALICVHSLA